MSSLKKINVVIAGATGYIGIQLIKILCNHKKINIKYLCGTSSVGKKLSYYDKTLVNTKLPKIIKFNKKLLSNIDIVFTALPNGESQKISKLLLKENGDEDAIRSQRTEFRVKVDSAYIIERLRKVFQERKNET